MKIIENCLSEKILREVKFEFLKRKNDSSWKINLFEWDKNLLDGTTGICGILPISDTLKKQVEIDVKKYLPFYEYFDANFQVWFKGSGIALHNDDRYLFGATIYLNQEWDSSWGGIFSWIDFPDSDLYNSILPKNNLMVINHEKKYHMVTPVAYTSPQYRLTIQIWGK